MIRILHPSNGTAVQTGAIVMVDIEVSGDWSFERDGDVCLDVGTGAPEVSTTCDLAMWRPPPSSADDAEGHV